MSLSNSLFNEHFLRANKTKTTCSVSANRSINMRSRHTMVVEYVQKKRERDWMKNGNFIRQKSFLQWTKILVSCTTGEWVWFLNENKKHKFHYFMIQKLSSFVWKRCNKQWALPDEKASLFITTARELRWVVRQKWIVSILYSYYVKYGHVGLGQSSNKSLR